MIDFDKSGGLVPAIAQDADTGEVLEDARAPVTPAETGDED